MIAIWQWKFRLTVLIVAKCIVNEGRKEVEKKTNNVLIVAKCIVNLILTFAHVTESEGINSSKV